MNVKSLPQLEERFRMTGNNGEYTFRRISIPVKEEDLTLDALLATPRNRSGYYYAIQHPKKRIVLHFTAGQLRSDLAALTRHQYHVSVPFVIARDGTIFQLFPSSNWSGHIGKGLGNDGTGNAQDKCSIGIELSNYGFLTKNGDALETYYSRQPLPDGSRSPADIYCQLNETDAYTKLDSPFRQQDFYAGYTAQQYNSLIILLRFLTSKYNIPRQFLPPASRFITTPETLDFNGIVSHINYRVSGKWDIGPAFDWDKVINGVQAPAYQPVVDRDAVVEKAFIPDGEPDLHSEEDMQPYLPEPRDPELEDSPYPDPDLGKREGILLPDSNKKPNIFALIIGINEYEEAIILNQSVRFPKLSGCVDDAKKIQRYLEQDPVFEAHIHTLFDRKATKENIVDAFRTHLSQAGKDDRVLFYFSGHGTQEYADTQLFPTETDGRLECIACYYDEARKNDFLLADKELRFLIHELSSAGPHILAIFDCCHSADNTRNAAAVKAGFETAIEKRIPYSFPMRSWEHFVFHAAIDPEEFIKEGSYQQLPQGNHLQLAACESDESAVEIGGAGVFTKTLLKILEAAGGEITYHSLESRLRQYMRSVYGQKPRLYFAPGNDGLLQSCFLNRPFQFTRNLFAEISYNDNIGWLINLGVIHGLKNHTGEILFSDKSAAPGHSKKVFPATLNQVYMDHASLLVKGDPDRNKVYETPIDGLLAAKISVYLPEDNAPPKDQLRVMEYILGQPGNAIETVTEESAAQYVLRFRKGYYSITYPNDPNRPLCQLVKSGDQDAPEKLAAIFKHISSWEFIRNIENPEDNRLSDKLLKVDINTRAASGTVEPLKVRKGKAAIHFRKIKGVWQEQLQVTLTNTSGENLYCAVLYLSANFESFTGFLHPPVYLLESGNTVALNLQGNDWLPVAPEPQMKWYNWEKQTDCLKFIFSKSPFDIRGLTLDKLEPPPIPGSDNRSIEKGIGTLSETAADSYGWATRDIVLEMYNPVYNQLTENSIV
ncbi:caspase family protein [Flavihumibacter fluvii]|uniref:caspase family protein n=1 Tax=Flavihumibacter fluvii TaxID=2838157 RepID=UPI001BDF5D65|nr:caspase family protein [Flavihumibacter fluvii]ULQ51775.1 caspase family protein [Flavihumibacter fluvii]